MCRYVQILLPVLFVLLIVVSVQSYEMVLEDYAVNTVMVQGNKVFDVACDHTDGLVQYCKVTTTKGEVLSVTCSKTLVDGNDKYSCVINK